MPKRFHLKRLDGFRKGQVRLGEQFEDPHRVLRNGNRNRVCSGGVRFLDDQYEVNGAVDPHDTFPMPSGVPSPSAFLKYKLVNSVVSIGVIHHPRQKQSRGMFEPNVVLFA